MSLLLKSLPERFNKLQLQMKRVDYLKKKSKDWLKKQKTIELPMKNKQKK